MLPKATTIMGKFELTNTDEIRGFLSKINQTMCLSNPYPIKN